MKDLDLELVLWKRISAVLCVIPTVCLVFIGIGQDATAFGIYNSSIIVLALLSIESYKQIMLLWIYLTLMAFMSLVFTVVVPTGTGVFWPITLIHTAAYLLITMIVGVGTQTFHWIKGTK